MSGAVEHAPNIADSIHLLDQADDFGNEHESTALLDISTSINACQFLDCSEISTHNFPGSDTPALCLTHKLNGMADMLTNHDIENREWFNEIVDSTVLASEVSHRNYPSWMKVAVSESPAIPLSNSNFAAFVRVITNDNSSKKYLYSVVTVNLRGSQMTRELWGIVGTYLSPVCPSTKKPNSCRCRDENCSLHHCTCVGPGQEFSFSLCSASDSSLIFNNFGELKFEVLHEAKFHGDEIFLEHGLELTIQKLRCLLTSDFVFSHTILGLTNDYRHGKYTCLHCLISKPELAVPWHLLPVKPTKRTLANMAEGLESIRKGCSVDATKGVVSEPILDFAPDEVVIAFVHVFMGVFNKIYDVLRDKLVELVDKPYMARSNEALEMEGKIAALDQKQREHAAMILALSEQLVELKSEKATLVKYKASLFKKRNTLTKKLGAEIKEIDKQLQQNGKKAKKLVFK